MTSSSLSVIFESVTRCEQLAPSSFKKSKSRPGFPERLEILVVQGADALEFLQGQLTADLAGLLPGQSLLSAWCNPKGRVICLLRVTATGSGYTLALPTELADDVIKRLTLFRFRSKVEFTV